LQPTAGFLTRITCRLTAKNRDQLRNPTLGSRIWATFTFLKLYLTIYAFNALTLLVGRQEGHPACKKTEWWGAGVVICLKRGADLHMAQLMPLPLTAYCFSKIQIGFSFLVPAHLGSPGQRAVNRVCYMCQYCIVRRARCVGLVGLAEIAGVRPRRVCTSNVVVLGGGGGASSPAVMPPLRTALVRRVGLNAVPVPVWPAFSHCAATVWLSRRWLYCSSMLSSSCSEAEA